MQAREIFWLPQVSVLEDLILVVWYWLSILNVPLMLKTIFIESVELEGLAGKALPLLFLLKVTRTFASL